MNRGTMRALLRRRLNETTPDLWQDTELNDLLNSGLHLVEKEVLKVDPLAFIHWSDEDIAKTINFYAKPQGFWHEMEVGYKSSSHAIGYKRLEKQDYNVARERTGGDTVYCHVGRYLGIFPTPGADVTDGLRLLWTPSLTMATDADVPDLHFALHMAVVLMSQKYALGETSDDQARVKVELSELLGDISMYYLGSATENERLWLDPSYLSHKGE